MNFYFSDIKFSDRSIKKSRIVRKFNFANFIKQRRKEQSLIIIESEIWVMHATFNAHPVQISNDEVS